MFLKKILNITRVALVGVMAFGTILFSKPPLQPRKEETYNVVESSKTQLHLCDILKRSIIVHGMNHNNGVSNPSHEPYGYMDPLLGLGDGDFGNGSNTGILDWLENPGGYAVGAIPQNQTDFAVPSDPVEPIVDYPQIEGNSINEGQLTTEPQGVGSQNDPLHGPASSDQSMHGQGCMVAPDHAGGPACKARRYHAAPTARKLKKRVQDIR